MLRRTTLAGCLVLSLLLAGTAAPSSAATRPPGKSVPTASNFTLLYPAANGTWARWNPCQRIDFRVNPGTTRKSLAAARIADARGAATRLSKATGIAFAYRGKTHALPGKARSVPEAGTELVIAWAAPGASPWMPKPKRGKVGFAGLGGATSLTTTLNAAGARTEQITTAGVLLDSTLPLAGGFGSGPKSGWQGTRGQLLMHEMAHASGLGHTRARSEIMYDTLLRRPATWGKGDLAGLRLIGRSQGCLTPLPAAR